MDQFSDDLMSKWIMENYVRPVLDRDTPEPSTCSPRDLNRTSRQASSPSTEFLYPKPRFDLTFFKGDAFFETQGFPQELLEGLDTNCEKFGTKYPSCARTFNPSHIGLKFDRHGQPAPFVDPLTNEILDVAEFMLEDHNLKVLVAQGRSGSNWNKGRPAILVNFSKKSGMRTLWHVWNPLDTDEYIKKHAQIVEKATDGSFVWKNGELVYKRDHRAARTEKRKLEQSPKLKAPAVKKRKTRNAPAQKLAPQQSSAMVLDELANGQDERRLVHSSTPFPSTVNPVDRRARSVLMKNQDQITVKESIDPPDGGLAEPCFIFKTSTADWKKNVEPLSECNTVTALFGHALYYGTSQPATFILQICIEGETQSNRYRQKDIDDYKVLVQKMKHLALNGFKTVIAIVTAFEYRM